MQYSNKLKQLVKEAYPNSIEINNAAEEGRVILGRYLDDSSSSTLSIETVLNATSLEELQVKARENKKKLDLYILWGEEYDAVYKNIQQF